MRFSERQINTTVLLANQWQLGASGDTVQISIYDMDDNTAEVSAAAMTNETGGLFSYSWTPTEQHYYRVDYYNVTLQSHEYEIVKVSGSAQTSYSGSTLATLRVRFLKLIDNYNPNDLTGTNSSGEIADLCINDALQLIYSQIKSTRHMEAYALTLSSTANVAYIEISGIQDADEIRALKDTDNDFTLTKISAEEYFAYVQSQDAVVGTPFSYCRIFNRLYLLPTPSAVKIYTTEYIKFYPRLLTDSDQALVPYKFDDWVMKEAKVLWYTMEDANNVPQIVLADRADARRIYLDDMNSHFDEYSQARSHFGPSRFSSRGFDRL